MKTRIKNIFIVIAGMAAAVIVMMIMESIPVGPELTDETRNNPELLNAFLLQLPWYAYLWIAFGYSIGSIFGGAVVHLFNPDSNRNIVKLSAVLMTFGILNMLLIAHPWWFWGHLIVYFPSAFLGQQIIKKIQKRNNI
jgi:hypothetical protein